ncbi:MAG: MFS transporter [Gammaproteobacteria bacterium]|nr:MAG: MFS transporter [Gammaproteobacteria bacterium]UTW43831.1 MFS transporter [bacterium SCSIO 12844]
MSYLKKRLDLFKNPSFNYIILMTLFNALSIGIIYVSLSWHILTIHNSITAIVTLMATWWLPGPLLGPIGGYLADRFPKKKLLIACDSTVILLLIIFLLLPGGMNNLTSVYLFTLGWGILYGLSWPSNIVLMREILNDDSKLLYANSTLDTVFEFGMIIGMGSGGLIIAWLHFTQIMMLVLILMLFTITFLILVKSLKHTQAQHRERFFASWVAVVKHLNTRKFLWYFFGAQVLMTAIFMTTPTFIAPYVKNVLHASSLEFGIIEIGFSAGFIVGNLVLPAYAGRYGEAKIAIFALIMCIILFTLMALNRSVWAAFGLYFLVGIMLSSWALVVTLAQKNTDIQLQGKAEGFFNGLSGLGVFFIYATLFVSDTTFKLPADQWFYLIALFSLITIIPIWLGLKKYHLRDQPN